MVLVSHEVSGKFSRGEEPPGKGPTSTMKRKLFFSLGWIEITKL